ncbi:hypothetical protein VT84_12100 [Gemmata sp. SH-PL17]|nr:hypothetical protein VT84_12100 [Gemmata sp. SH-PL17]
MDALGRPAEATNLYQAALKWRVKQENWDKAANIAINLSSVKLALGDISGAVATARESVNHAERREVPFIKRTSRTALATALHQAGHSDEAQLLFRQSEELHSAIQVRKLLLTSQYPSFEDSYPFLSGLGGFQYCESLLAHAEREAWQQVLHLRDAPSDVIPIESCRQVTERATPGTENETGRWIQDVGLDHLTLERAMLYRSILESATPELNDAMFRSVERLRRGRSSKLALGLLTRAWSRAFNSPERAQSDLDEAWEIAASGPMPLLQADIYLYRARLFAHVTPYPWAENPDAPPRGPKDDLQSARHLIEKHGYWRRKEELEDAEMASKNWPNAQIVRTITPSSNFLEKAHMSVATKTVLELDLVGYSTIAAELEHNLGVETSPQLNKQIQNLIDSGLSVIGLERKTAVMQTTGDGAILVFDHASQAHDFAEAVTRATRAHNANKPVGTSKRVFRIGIATGDLVMEAKESGGFEIGGIAISRAVRLETKAKPGEVLCDTYTFSVLTEEQRKRYSKAETVTGKRDEKFEAHRAELNPDGVKDTAPFTSSGNPPTPPIRPDPFTQTFDEIRREIIKLIKKLRPLQFDQLIFLLNVPIGQRPPEALNLDSKMNNLLKWADEAGQVASLLLELRFVIEEGN